MTTTPPTTQPLSCVTDTGKHVILGQSLTEGCRTCDCTYHGLNCMYMDCLPPMCVDYVTRDGCCYTCPHGELMKPLNFILEKKLLIYILKQLHHIFSSLHQ